jgi:hypothetical protein
MILKDPSVAHAARVSQTARTSGEGKNAMAHSTATLKIAPPSTPVGAPNTVLPLTRHQPRVTIHSRSTRGPRRAPARWGVTRHSLTSRNARNLLKTNNGDPLYPAHFSAPNRVLRHADFRPSTAARAGAPVSCQWKRRASAPRKRPCTQPILSRWVTRADSSVCTSRQSALATSRFLNPAGLKTPALHLNLPSLPRGEWVVEAWTSISHGKAQLLRGVPETLRVLGRLIGTPERLETSLSPWKSISLTLLIGTDLVTKSHHFDAANFRAVRVRILGRSPGKFAYDSGARGPTIRLSRATWDGQRSRTIRGKSGALKLR